MDSLYYSRISMSGWVFLAVLLLSLWETNSQQWQQIVLLTSKDQATFVLGVFGAIVGIGGPPAFGFLLEKIVAVILLIFRQNMWHYDSITGFRQRFDDALLGARQDLKSSSSAAIFHILFYTKADDKLLGWTRRRRTHMYASFNGSAAILLALVFAAVSFHVCAFWTTIVSLFLAIALFEHGRRELANHKQTISAWVDLYGRAIISELSIVAKKGVTSSKRRGA